MAKRQSAFSKALQEAQSRTTVKPSNREEAIQSDSATVSPPSSTTVERLDSETATQSNSATTQRSLAKTSFYIRPDQADKLDDLAYHFKRQRGKRIDRQDIIRALIDNSSLDQLLDFIP